MSPLQGEPGGAPGRHLVGRAQQASGAAGVGTGVRQMPAARATSPGSAQAQAQLEEAFVYKSEAGSRHVKGGLLAGCAIGGSRQVGRRSAADPPPLLQPSSLHWLFSHWLFLRGQRHYMLSMPIDARSHSLTTNITVVIGPAAQQCSGGAVQEVRAASDIGLASARQARQAPAERGPSRPCPRTLPRPLRAPALEQPPHALRRRRTRGQAAGGVRRSRHEEEPPPAWATHPKQPPLAPLPCTHAPAAL